jgi:hypothetical protein
MQLATMKIKNQAGHAMIVNVCDLPQWKAKGYVEDVPVPESPKADGEKAETKTAGPKDESQTKGQAKQK